MKKMLLGAALVGAAILGANSANAQSSDAVGVYIQKVNVEKLKATVAKSDAEVADPAKAGKSATWIKRGNMFVDVDSKPVNGLYVGIDEPNLKASVPADTVIDNVKVGEADYVVYRSGQADIYVKDGLVTFYTPSVVIDPMALDKAYEAFDKAFQMDPKSAKKVKDGMKKIHESAKLDAEIFFSYLDNMPLAATNFKMAYKASAHPAVNEPDTVALFNAGYASALSRDFKTAVEDLDAAIAMGYESNGVTYYLKAISQSEMGEKDAAFETMKQGRERFPANEGLIRLIVQHYTNEGLDPSSLIDDVQAAIDNNPDNPLLYEALAGVFKEMKRYDEAIATVHKAVEKEPNNWYFSFLEGTYIVTKGNTMSTENANKAMSLSAAQNQANKDAVNTVYKEGLVAFERALELVPEANKVTVVEWLKNLTFILRDDAEVAAKYEKYNEMSKQLSK